MPPGFLAFLTLPCLCLQAQAPATEPAPASTLAAPIKVDLAPLFATAERTTPVTPPGVETWINLPGMAKGSPAYRFNLYRDPLYFVVKGNRLVVHTTVNYWFEVGLQVNGWFKGMGSCGKPPESFRRARLGLQAEVALTPDWGLDLKLTPEEPLRYDGCPITFLGYDITDKVLAGMKENLAKAAQALQDQIRDAVKLRPRAEEAWFQAQQPVELAPGVFLQLNPERLRLGPWSSQGKELTLTPEIQIRPAVTLGVRPDVALRPLPPLDLAPLAIAPGFHLRVDADLSYAHAATQLLAQLGGKPFETEKGTFLVTGVAIRAQDGLALLDLDLKGRVNGRLTLKGRPVYHEATGTLQLENLDYDLASRSLVTNLGEWLFRGTLRKALNEQCSFFMDKSLKDLKSATEAGLNRTLAPGVAMTGVVDAFHVSRVEVLEDRFKALAELEGVVRLAVAPDVSVAPTH